VRTIHKYPLAITDTQVIESHSFAHPLTVQMQNGQLCLWAVVDTSRRVATYPVTVVGTGHPMQETPGHYVGSAQDGPFVWHVFTNMGQP
jgi:hypothetical protein